MKILQVHNYYQQSGGEDAVVEAERKLLIDHGQEVETVTFDNHDIRTPADKISVLLGLLYNRSSARKIERSIITFNPDVVHVHNFLPIASPSVFYTAAQYHIPVVHTLHNYRLICPSAFMFYSGAVYDKSLHTAFPLDAIRKGVYRNSVFQTAAVSLMTAYHHIMKTWRNKIDRYIVLTPFARDKFMASALRISKHKFVIKPNFVEDYGCGDIHRENFFLFVGRLSPEKGIDTLLQAAGETSFEVIIIGDGPMKRDVEEAARRYPSITYLGHRPKPDVIAYLKRCRALIFPSIWYEGLPVIILEAFSTATPVLASRLGSMANIITDHVNGLHFEAGDVRDLVRVMDYARSNSALLQKLSAHARLTYLKAYTPQVNYNLLMQLYHEVCHHDKLPLTINHTKGITLSP